MITKLMLTADDVLAMLASVLEYNRRGKMIGVTYHDAAGSRVDVAYAEVYAEERGLAVRSLPEPDAQAQINPPVLDPRQIPGVASIQELIDLAGE